MSLRIQNNIEAFNAHRQLQGTSDKAAKAMERLSSGYRINRAADDAAGLAISEKMRSQIGGVAQAQRNAQDGVSLVQTAEGALSEVHSMLQRVRDLKVQSENDTLNADDKGAIEKEVVALGKEIKDIGSQTKFNGISLLNGSTGATVSFQVGANTGEQITADVSSITAGAGMTKIVGTDGTSGKTLADMSIDDVDTAIKEVSTRRADLGAYQENLTASESRIRDVDMASEMVNFSKLQILQQAGTAMLAQANQAPQGVLSLLR